MEAEAERDTWRSWLGDDPQGRTIYGEMVEMLAFRQIWKGFALVHDSAPEGARKNATFSYWVRWNYARSMGSAIRRQVDVRDDVVSLGRLIDRVWKYPTALTRDSFRATQGNDEDADRSFDKLAGTGDYINPEIPAKDLEALRRQTAPIRRWVNKAVAHVDQKERDAPSLQELHSAVDNVFDLFNKYYVLIHGATVVRGVVMSSWATVFRVPWIPEDRWTDVARQIIALEREDFA